MVLYQIYFFQSFDMGSSNMSHCLCNPLGFMIIFFLFFTFLHLKTLFRGRSTDFRWPAGLYLRKGSEPCLKGQRRKEKAETLLIKFSNFTILLLAKKAAAPLRKH